MAVNKRCKKRLRVMYDEKTSKFISEKAKTRKSCRRISFSVHGVYYESDMEGINSGQYQVFTMYPSLYIEESDDDFWSFAMEFYGLPQNKNVLIAVKIIDSSPETKKQYFRNWQNGNIQIRKLYSEHWWGVRYNMQSR